MITTAALVVLAVAGAAVGMAWRGPRPRRMPLPAGVVPTAFRLCPDKHRVRAAIQHADGTAACADCGAHIPAAGA